MATARPVNLPLEDLTRCGICNDIIYTPKALTCLHTFCLECLKEWSKQSSKIVTCPITTCKKTTPMPSDGVEGLPGNEFVSSLIERSSLRGKRVPCVCCRETNSKVLGRCIDCKGFLCQKGVDLHQEMLLESHQVIMMDDIKSGKVDLKKLADKKPPSCKEHEGQFLWLYCKTCGVLICRDCTVIDHQIPSHNYVTLRSIAADQRSKIRKQIKESEAIELKIKKALNETDEVKKKLDTNKRQVIAELDAEIVNIKKHVDKICEDERNRLLNQYEETALRSDVNISAANKTLQRQKILSKEGREMATEALRSRSDHEFAAEYSYISRLLQELCKMEPKSVSGNIGKLPKFTADSKFINITSIGKIPVTQASLDPSVETIPVPRVSSGNWIWESNISIKDVRGISTTPTGDIAITHASECAPIDILSRDGNLKLTVDKESSGAWNVVFNPAGQLFCSRGGRWSNCNVIHKFGSNGIYFYKFPAISPAGVASDAEKTDLRGLAMNHKIQILIGEVNKNYISIHSCNGGHLISFKVSIPPYFIATTSNDDIIVSPHGWFSVVQILDRRGALKHTINAPDDVSNWYPRGVCCSINDEICVSNYCTPLTVYCFTSKGGYLGCIATDIEHPCGLTLLENDQKLAVAVNDCVKIFNRK